MWYWSVRMSGKFLPISAKRSSQYGMVKVMPLDLVAEVRCFFGRGVASSKANSGCGRCHAGEDGSAAKRIRGRCLEHAAADGGVFAFGVFAHDVEVDIGLGAVGQWRAHAGHELAGAQVHVLVEAAADGDQQTPEGDVVGDVGPADGAEQDGVGLARRSMPSAGIMAPVFL